MDESVRCVPTSTPNTGVVTTTGGTPKRGLDVCGAYDPQVLHNNLVVNSICPQNNYGTDGQTMDMTAYGVQPHYGPKNVSYKAIDVRLRSFNANNCWDPMVPVCPEDLARAGFYSIGMSDYVKCFYCDGGLCNWEPGDDPWVEHAKWFPNCQFVKLNKSQVFVDECRRMAEREHQRQSNGSTGGDSDSEYNSSGDDYEDNERLLAINAVNEWMHSDIVLQLIDLDAFPMDVIKGVLNKRWYDERQPFSSFAQIYDAVSEWRRQPLIQTTHFVEPVSIENTGDEPNTSSDDELNYSLPSSQSSVSSTTSTLSSYSSSPEASQELSPTTSAIDDNRLLCKICLDREIGVVFLPCGHQLACTLCAPCVTDCPICRCVIKGSVRTFFS
ncbi:putative inhibitor of apoptosis [Oppia nitens]|uniref:putative inhibitor of apoptosis n=1 Tax=Oppia nitens TaxID=1686743 RepID=UPI0023DB356B|nr:putative inhibitor of apoptosis [Oppia nitens]